MELRTYLSLVMKWLWLIVLAVTIAAVSSFFASRAAPRLYSTKTTLMVGRVTQNPDPSSTEINTGNQLALTYTQLARREPVLRGTIESLGLKMSWETLATQVRANVIPQTQLIEISVIDSDPYRAKVLADTIAQQLILQSPTTPNSTSQEQIAFTQLQLKDLEQKIQTTQQEVIQLKQELDGANSSRTIQDLQNQINLMDSKIGGWQNTYSQLLLSLQGGNVNALSVIEEATLPKVPFSPNVGRNVMLAAVIGLALAIGGAFLIEYLDDTVKTPDDIAHTANLPTLGGIPRNSSQDFPDRLVAVKQPLSPVVESYRVLRTNLQFSALDRPIQTLMITSPGPADGKSTVLSNLAVVLAQSGMRVIAVDTDLRRPTLHKIFGVANRYGLTDAVLHPDPLLEERLQVTEVKNLRILTSGSLPPNPAELLGSIRMRETIDELKNYADIVIFDSSPVLLFADAAILGTRLDGVMLVLQSGRTRRMDARKVVEDLQRVQVNLLGVVLNRLTPGSRNYYHQYYYYTRPDEANKPPHGISGFGAKRKLPQLNPTTEEQRK